MEIKLVKGALVDKMLFHDNKAIAVIYHQQPEIILKVRNFGIKPLIDLPGVGAHFQQECLQQITLNRYLNPISKALIGAQWLLFKSGIGASNQFSIPYPDIQFHFLPAAK